ncbi:MAG TPA: nucleoside monophosphate kinase [Candidatus Paceibacterota bacterium]|nr:nucleoside monophosphate kinase [Candidatus Paceibacterota bacterium]
MNPLTVIFLGPQGCGKGTHAELLEAYLRKSDPPRQVLYFSAGKQLRAFVEEKSYTADLNRSIIEKGGLLPTFLSVHVFADQLMREMKGNEHLLIDGFPRTEDQVPVLDSALRFYKREQPVVVYINISDEEAVKRLLKRGRADDTEEGIRARLAWTREHMEPILAWFRGNPAYRVAEINGERSIEEVHADVDRALGLA